MPSMEAGGTPSEARESIKEEEIKKYSRAIKVLDLEDQLSSFLIGSEDKEELLDSEVVGSEVIQNLFDRLEDLGGKIADNLTFVSEEDEQAKSDLTHLLIEKRRMDQEGRRAVQASPGYFSLEDMRPQALIRSWKEELEFHEKKLGDLRRERSKLPMFGKKEQKRELDLAIKAKKAAVASLRANVRGSSGKGSEDSERVERRQVLADRIGGRDIDPLKSLKEQADVCGRHLDIALTAQDVIKKRQQRSGPSTPRQAVAAEQCLADLKVSLQQDPSSRARAKEKKEKLDQSYQQLLEALNIEERVIDLNQKLEQVLLDLKEQLVDRTTKVNGIIGLAETSGTGQVNPEMQELSIALKDQFQKVKLEYD